VSRATRRVVDDDAGVAVAVAAAAVDEPTSR
jgi:hypothetical protein